MRILVLNLEDQVRRRETCLAQLSAMDVPEEAVKVVYSIRVSDYDSVSAFCEYAGETFPVFRTLELPHQTSYLGVNYGHLRCLQALSQMDEGELGMILEDDCFLNVGYAPLCKQLRELQQHADAQGHPFMAQLRTWRLNGQYDAIYSLRDDEVHADRTLMFPTQTLKDTFYYGYPGLGCWATVYDAASAQLFMDAICADLRQGHLNFQSLTTPPLSELSEIGYLSVNQSMFPLDIYIYEFAAKLPYFTVDIDAGLILQNDNEEGASNHDNADYNT